MQEHPRPTVTVKGDFTMTDHNFTPFEIDNQQEKSSLAGYISTGFSVLLLGISGLASFAFFGTFAPGLLASLLPADLASIFAGLIGLLLMEGSVIAWHYLATRDADTQKQIALARAGYIFSLVLSVSVTVSWFALSSDLASSWVTGQTESTVKLASLLLLIVAVAAQFVLSSEYRRAAQATQEATHEAAYRAQASTAKHTVKQAQLKANLEGTVNNIMKRLPTAAAKHSQEQAENFIDHSYSQNGKKQPARPTKNR